MDRRLTTETQASQHSNALCGLMPTAAQERDACFEEIVREFQPASFTETLLARDLARHAARLLQSERLLDAVQAQAAAAVATVVIGDATPAGGPPSLELYFPQRFDSLTRTAQRNSLAFHQGVRQFRELRQARRAEAEFVSGATSDFLTRRTA